jgi:hypothetical protein
MDVWIGVSDSGPGQPETGGGKPKACDKLTAPRAHFTVPQAHRFSKTTRQTSSNSNEARCLYTIWRQIAAKFTRPDAAPPKPRALADAPRAIGNDARGAR